MLVLKGLVGLHRTIQLQLLQRFWLGHRLGLLWYWMICLGNEQRQKHSVIFEISPHWDTTSSQSEKNLQATNAREGEEKRETFYWWECKLLQPLRRTVWRFLKTTKYRIITWSSNPIPGHISGQNYNSESFMHPYVHSSTIHHSQDMETIWMSISRRGD